MYYNFCYIYRHWRTSRRRNRCNDDAKVIKESNREDLINVCNDSFYIAIELVRRDKDRVLDSTDFDGNEMIDVLLDELDFKNTSPINYDINSLQLEDYVQGGRNYFRPFFDNVSTNPFKWLPDFSLQRSTILSGVGSVWKGNTVKFGDIFNDKKHLKDAVA